MADDKNKGTAAAPRRKGFWGWIIGLAIHGAVAWLSPMGRGIYEALLRRERDRLNKR